MTWDETRKKDVFACFLKRGGGGQRKVLKLDTKTKTLEGYPISLQISSFPLSPRALAAGSGGVCNLYFLRPES